tara:strand:- start:201 stop:1034 length:834 start_codon:yes stop_codon:yes gene_type:complete
MDRTKILSGGLLVLIITPCFFLLPLNILTSLISIIVGLSSWEFFKLRFSFEISLLLSLILFFSLIYLSFGVGFQLTVSSIGILLWIILALLILGFPHNKNILQNNFFWVFSGFFIHISFCTSIFLILNHSDPLLESIGIGLSPRATLVFLIGLSASMDSLAYFGGKKFGKTKFLPNISPNKTFEGFIIAVLGTPFLVMLILSLFYEYSFFKVLVIILIVSIFSVLGDATASLFKRISGVKDSSNLIPGHGGIFDRIDSHLAAAPCFVLIAFIINGIQ